MLADCGSLVKRFLFIIVGTYYSINSIPTERRTSDPLAERENQSQRLQSVTEALKERLVRSDIGTPQVAIKLAEGTWRTVKQILVS